MSRHSHRAVAAKTVEILERGTYVAPSGRTPGAPRHAAFRRAFPAGS